MLAPANHAAGASCTWPLVAQTASNSGCKEDQNASMDEMPSEKAHQKTQVGWKGWLHNGPKPVDTHSISIRWSWMSYLSILLATIRHPWVIGLATHTTYRVGLSRLSKMHSQKQYGGDGTLKTFHAIWDDSMMYKAYMKKKCLTDLQHLAATPSGLFNRFREFVDFNHQGSSRGRRTSSRPTVAGRKCMAWS